MRVDHALRRRGRARRVADHGGPVGVHAARARGAAARPRATSKLRAPAGSAAPSAARTTTTCSSAGSSGRSTSSAREEILAPEAVRGHQHPRAGLAQDVAQLLRAVEVDDRHQRRAEHGDAVEGLGGLGPVRELERDDVAGPDPEAPQPSRQTPARGGRPRRARPRTDAFATRSGTRAGGGRRSGGAANAPRRLVVPEARPPGSGAAARRARSAAASCARRRPAPLPCAVGSLPARRPRAQHSPARRHRLASEARRSATVIRSAAA